MLKAGNSRTPFQLFDEILSNLMLFLHNLRHFQRKKLCVSSNLDTDTGYLLSLEGENFLRHEILSRRSPWRLEDLSDLKNFKNSSKLEIMPFWTWKISVSKST